MSQGNESLGLAHQNRPQSETLLSEEARQGSEKQAASPEAFCLPEPQGLQRLDQALAIV